MKVGAENMIAMYQGHSSREKKLLAEARQMLSDAKTKIEIIRIQIMRRQQKGGPDVIQDADREFGAISLLECPSFVTNGSLLGEWFCSRGNWLLLLFVTFVD